jgi:hypothetical protein
MCVRSDDETRHPCLLHDPLILPVMKSDGVDAPVGIGWKPLLHPRFEPLTIGDDMPAMIEFNPGVVRVIIQKSSKSANVRNTVISRVSTASRPAFVHKSWSNAYGRWHPLQCIQQPVGSVTVSSRRRGAGRRRWIADR